MIEPKRQALAEANAQLEEANTKLAACRRRLRPEATSPSSTASLTKPNAEKEDGAHR